MDLSTVYSDWFKERGYSVTFSPEPRTNGKTVLERMYVIRRVNGEAYGWTKTYEVPEKVNYRLVRGPISALLTGKPMHEAYLATDTDEWGAERRKWFQFAAAEIERNTGVPRDKVVA